MNSEGIQRPETISAKESGNIIRRLDINSPQGKALDSALNSVSVPTEALVDNTESWLENASPEDLSELFQLYETLVKHTVSDPAALKSAAKAFAEKINSVQT